MARTAQTFENHRKVVPLYHFGMYGTMLLLLIGTSYLLFTTEQENILLPLIMFLLICCVILISLYSRQFALRAQDRAIRAEENLRYYILTGKRMQKVSMRQIIALRFASDEEFVALTDRASLEKMTPIEIKKAIKNWRPDYHRA
jgi:hypothetical protein